MSCHSSNEQIQCNLTSSMTIGLVGNPNCGKTTLFNALTGSRQRVGNWPGVTVERKKGYFVEGSVTVEVVDLPGIYSLTTAGESAIDERIASDCILAQSVDLIVNIVDASNLERHLYLTTQLIEMNLPVMIAVNMQDIARSRKVHINLAKLAQELGCVVVGLQANSGKGITTLKNQIVTASNPKRAPLSSITHFYPKSILEAITALGGTWQAIRLLENDLAVRQACAPEYLQQVAMQQALIQSITGEESDILIADARYRYIQQVLNRCITQGEATASWTNWIDKIVLNRVLGIPIFLATMYLLFFFSINIGGAFQDFFDLSSQTLFVDGFAYGLQLAHVPNWLIVLLANGIGKGINTTITFIPVIGALFLFLALLEDSGYMARAAFVIDRLMRALGLPGKAFIPMIVGFGCNVPAIMAARTLDNKRDRILTIMMSPFMSCGARLAIYAVFTAAFFPQGGQNIVFALYVIGILMAMLTGLMLRQTLLKGDPSPLIMELPAYHIPQLKTILLHAWQRLKGFVFRAGKLIVPICVLIGVLNSLNLDGTMNTGEGDMQSLLSLIGQWMTPIFTPMGIQSDNWPATVGLVTGILAKEVVVGTLNTLYAQLGQVASLDDHTTFSLLAGFKEALTSIPANFSQLGVAFSHPILAQVPGDALNQGVYGVMYHQFDGQVGAFAYLLFVLLYFPCISTTAVMLRELHRGWALFSIVWMTGVAYGVAVFFYQAATWHRHSTTSLLWMIAILLMFTMTIITLRWITTKPIRQELIHESH